MFPFDQGCNSILSFVYTWLWIHASWQKILGQSEWV